jgi:iron-sulfur cluster repair protein YtfE (RIC family)
VDDVFTVLTADHDRILALSGRLTGGAAPTPAGPKERKAIADELVMELSRHEVAEEMLLWPAVRDRADDGQELCATALEQEAKGKRLLNELVKTSPDNEEFHTLTHSVAAMLREHISYEQNIVWPRLRLKLSQEEARQLGTRIAQAKRRAPARPHPHVPARPGLLKKVAPAAAVLDMARNALVRRR